MTAVADRAVDRAVDRADRPSFPVPEARHGGGGYLPRGITLARGRGARLEDVEGRTYIDCVSGHGAACLGHGHPALASAVAEQASRLMLCPGSFGSEIRGRYLSRLSEHTGLERFFLCNSGTEAVEAAIKYARVHTGRRRVVATMRGFHGRTLGSLSITWEKRYRKPFAPLVPEVAHVPYDDLAAVEQALEGGEVAAVVVEPIQGEGGVRLPGDDYLPGLRRLCDRRGTLLVLDEVQTGFGRTGRLLAHHGTTCRPDLVALGKAIAGGVPMGALGIRDGLPPFAAGAHGSTFGGNPLACAAAAATLETLVGERLPERAARLGEEALGRLRERLDGLPTVREIRGRGLMLGIELRRRVGPVLQALAGDGILALGAGPTVIRLLPPLVIEDADWRRVIECLAVRIREVEIPS